MSQNPSLSTRKAADAQVDAELAASPAKGQARGPDRGVDSLAFGPFGEPAKKVHIHYDYGTTGPQNLNVIR